MIIKIATCLLALAVFSSCQTTQSTASTSTSSHQNLQQRVLAQNTAVGLDEPAPPAEGPEDIPAEGPVDPNRNPGLLPTPLLRANAIGGL
jgi:hypothetical protein